LVYSTSAWGHFARQLAHGLASFFFRQLAPLLCVTRQPLLIDDAGAAVLPAVAVLHRTAWIGSWRTARLPAVRSGAPVGSGPLLLVLQLFDDLIKSPNHLGLHLLGLRAAAGQLQSPLDVVHLAGDPTQILVLPRLHVVKHEQRDDLVAIRRVGHVLHHADDRPESLILKQQGM